MIHDPLLFPYLACFALHALRACCAGVVAARMLPRLPAWNRACARHTGKPWLGLLLDRKGNGDLAHPGALGALLLTCLILGAAAAHDMFSGQEAADAALLANMTWAARAGCLAAEAALSALLCAAPAFMVGEALSDPSSAIASSIRDEERLGAAMGRSDAEAAQLRRALPSSGLPKRPATRL